MALAMRVHRRGSGERREKKELFSEDFPMIIGLSRLAVDHPMNSLH
jgi:hypothetical protein